MDFALNEKIHRFIIIDLTIRTLERDMKYLDSLKTKRAFKMWFEKSIQSLSQELKQLKRELGKNGVKLQSENIGSDGFTEYTFIDKGRLDIRRYSNIALRNWVEEEVKRLLGLEYGTTESRK